MRKALIGLVALAILGVLGFLTLTSPSVYRLIRPEPAAAAGRTPDVENGRIRTRTNRSGGVQGGITNGETIYFRVAFKPTATIMREQRTVDIRHEETTIQGRGRHDPCVLPRAVPMVEAMTAVVLADHALRQQSLA